MSSCDANEPRNRGFRVLLNFFDVARGVGIACRTLTSSLCICSRGKNDWPIPERKKEHFAVAEKEP